MSSCDTLPPFPAASQFHLSKHGGRCSSCCYPFFNPEPASISRLHRPQWVLFSLPTTRVGCTKTFLRVAEYNRTTANCALWIDNSLKPPGMHATLVTLKQVDGNEVTAGHLQLANVNYRAPIRMAGDSSSFWASEGLKFLFEEGLFSEASRLEGLLDNEGVLISTDALHSLLEKCISGRDLSSGREAHCCIVRCGHESDSFLGSHLIRMFAMCGSLFEAKQIFRKLHEPDVFAWSAIISAHAKLGQDKQAIDLFHQMQQSGLKPDGYVFAAVLKACANAANLVEGNLIHAQVTQTGFEEHLFIGNTLIDMYTRCGSLQAAYTVFDKLPERDLVSWNVLITGLVQHGCGHEAFQLFQQMQQEGMRPNEVTFVNLAKACASTATGLNNGKWVHAHLIESGLEADNIVGNTVIDMYSKCGSLSDAHRVFEKISKSDVVTWNTMIAGCAHHGHGEEACLLFQRMQEYGMEPNPVTFAGIFRCCANMAVLNEGRVMHACAIQCGFHIDVFIGSTLIDMYCQCGSLKDATDVFHRLPKQDVATWNAMIAGYSKLGYGQEAVKLFQQMQLEGITPNVVTFIGILKACTRSEALEQGQFIHTHIIGGGFEMELLIGSALIDMYFRCRSHQHAVMLFDRLQKHNALTWNAMIAGYAQLGNGQAALQLFLCMLYDGIQPSSATFISCLKALTDVEQGKCIHLHVIKSGLESDTFFGSTLIEMYARCGSLEDARCVFEKSSKQDVTTWSAMIAGFAQNDCGQESLSLFHKMQKEGIDADRITYAIIVKSCCTIASFDEFKVIHAYTVETGYEMDVFVSNALINMYAKSTSLQDADCIFDKMINRDVVTWNSMIAAYGQHGQCLQALQLAEQMQQESVKPDQCTYISSLKICSSIAGINQGMRIHNFIIESGFESDVCVGSALINMYVSCGSITDSSRMFNRWSNQDMVPWSALIAGYTQHKHGQKALEVFQQMITEGIEPDDVTFLNVLKVCSTTMALDGGKLIHASILECGVELDLHIANTLIDMYAKCGSLEDAERVFRKLQKQDVVTWSVMIAGYTQSGCEQVALLFFHQMQQVGLDPDQVTFVSSLKACSNIAALEQGKLIHSDIIESGYESNVFVGNSLILMYAKCGCPECASSVFEDMPERDLVTWNTMIAGYAQRCDYDLANRFFEQLQQAGLKPNVVTFVHLLSACSHVSRLDKGCDHFRSMREDYGVAPTLEHYNCMVDLLGRTGKLNEVEDLLETMPFGLNIIGWTSLLSNCRKFSDVKRGRLCFDVVVTIDSRNAVAYTLMSIIYAHYGMQEELDEIETLRQAANAWKKPGKAFIEVDNKVHDFVVQENIHPQSADIYAKLETLSIQMKEGGYVPLLDSVLQPMSDEDKEDALCGHCERLAIAFGLISTPSGTTIRISKNLRVCIDCHNATKIISKIESREIIITDAYCIHDFKNGACSCKDSY